MSNGFIIDVDEQCTYLRTVRLHIKMLILWYALFMKTKKLMVDVLITHSRDQSLV